MKLSREVILNVKLNKKKIKKIKSTPFIIFLFFFHIKYYIKQDNNKILINIIYFTKIRDIIILLVNYRIRDGSRASYYYYYYFYYVHTYIHYTKNLSSL